MESVQERMERIGAYEKIASFMQKEKTPEGAFNRGSWTRTHDHAFIGDALYPLSYAE